MWPFLQDSSQAEPAIERQNFVGETLQASTICISWSMPQVLCSTAAATLQVQMQGHSARAAVQSASPAPVTSRSGTNPSPAAQQATPAAQQQPPGVARRPPVSHVARTPPDSLMERWALAVAGQPPAAECQPAKAGVRGGAVEAGVRGAPGEQTGAAPGTGWAPMKRFVELGLVDRWATAVQAQQRRRQPEEPGRQPAGRPAVPGTAAAEKQAVSQKAAPAETSMPGTAAAGRPARLGKVPAAHAAKVAESPAQTRVDHRSLTARGTRPPQDAGGGPSSQPAAAPVPADMQAGNLQAAEAAPTGVQAERFVDPGGRWDSTVQQRGDAKGPARAAAQEAAAGKPATPGKGVVAPARTLMDRWGLAVRGIKPLPQEESSSKPAAGPSAAAEGQGVAGSQAAAWQAPPARPAGVQAGRFVEPGLMGRWQSAMQSREAGQQPGSLSLLVCFPVM